MFEEIFVKENDEDRTHGSNGLESLQYYPLKSMHQDMLTKLILPFGKHLSKEKNNPVISTILEKVDEKNIDYLMMRNMLATVGQAQVEIFKVTKDNDAQQLGLQGAELKTLVA